MASNQSCDFDDARTDIRKDRLLTFGICFAVILAAGLNAAIVDVCFCRKSLMRCSSFGISWI